MSVFQDALQLDESLGAGDGSRAWLVWSGAAGSALLMLISLVVDPFLVGEVLRFGSSDLVVTGFGK